MPVVTFLAPSFWMNLPSKVIHEPKTGLLGSWAPLPSYHEPCAMAFQSAKCHVIPWPIMVI